MPLIARNSAPAEACTINEETGQLLTGIRAFEPSSEGKCLPLHYQYLILQVVALFGLLTGIYAVIFQGLQPVAIKILR